MVERAKMLAENKPIKFIIISPYEEIHSCGVRLLSSYLKKKGVQVDIIFCPIQSRFDAYLYHRKLPILPLSIVNDIARIARDATCIGISLMTQHFNAVAVLTEELKKRLPHIPILWGGIHPTLFPEQCVDYADFVCIGEGYESTYELLQCLKVEDRFPEVPGICFRRGDDFVTNSLRHPISDVDLLPFMDYGFEGHYLRRVNSIVPMTPSLLKRHLGFWYTSFFTYGCPFSCSYCCNSVFHKLDPGYRTVRKHNPEYICEEIRFIRRLHPFIKMVKFNDDSFMSLTEEEMERFAVLQDKFGKIPFVATGMNPLFVTEQKIGTLVKAGLRRARIGIQSGSERILAEVYNRKVTKKDVICSSEILSRYSKQLVPTAYDVILDNPWEKPEDLLDTFKLVSQLRRPFVLNIFSLTFYPNTAIYKKALSENMIDAARDAIGYSKNYLAWDKNYLNFLIALEGLMPIPAFLHKYLLNRKIVEKNHLMPGIVRDLINTLTLTKKAYLHTLHRDVTMLPFFIARML